ncbi:hypothetical protein ABE205_13985 [Brevibacillus agri]|uniref:hypothetical protein n=1 Tax=Brevibacillus agri TaxID=51101 RepID=UPI0018CCE1D9|nr:hypothetical protein [Brevibacillus agri]MBG9568808.1 hypothetical protein [Brevibacillus agri]
MKRAWYILAAFAVLTGCSSDPKPEFKEVVSTLNTMVKPEDNPPAPAPPTSPPTEAPPEPKFSVPVIAGKTEADVTALLGEPAATENGEWTSMSSKKKTPFVRHTYKTDTGAISVMFSEGVAARIEVRPSETFKYPDDAMKAMRAAGLTVEDGLEPESEDPHFLDFGGVDGVYAVGVGKDLEGNPEKIGYVQIVTEERFK